MSLGIPVPRITESFVDLVIEQLKGRRLTEVERDNGSYENADYLFHGFTAELKIVEEEPLDKKERQDKIAKFFKKKFTLTSEVDLNIKHLMPEAKNGLKEILREPIQKRVRKASTQIRETKKKLGRVLDMGILVLVNNGYASLQPDEFDNLALTCCRKDSSNIDFLWTINVSCHDGDFDHYVFCKTCGYSIHGGIDHPLIPELQKVVGKLFTDRMTEVMRKMMSPGPILKPVSDISFERDGVRFVREAPKVPDSRFASQNEGR